MKKKLIIIITLLVVITIGVVIFILGMDSEQYVIRTERATQGKLELTVTATGYIQPVTKVEVGTQVSGIVTKIYVDFNSQVKQGQLLAELDKSTLSERVRQAKATLENAKSDHKLATLSYDRTKGLYEKNAASLASFEEAENRLAVAAGQVVTAQADYDQSLVNLSYAEIYSPISGRVLHREVDEGQTVAASFSTPTLFTIANDLTKMQVEANIDEADIGQIKVGQVATFSVDTYPGEIFNGSVSQIRLEPTVTSNVVTYTVIITAPNPDEKLYPGMTANITVTTESPQGVLVPTEAIYFTPDDTQLEEYTIENKVTSNSKLWVRTETGLESVAMVAGTSDGVKTIILSGVKEGDEIVVGVDKIVGGPKKKGASIFPAPPKGGKGGGPRMMH